MRPKLFGGALAASAISFWGSASPVSSNRSPATSTRSTTLATSTVSPSLGPTVGESGSGQRTWRVAAPYWSARP